MGINYKEFDAPAGIDDFETVVLRELTVEDEKTIAVWIDQKMKHYPDADDQTLAGVRALETLRRAIAAVDGVPTDGDLPFTKFDSFKQTTIVVLRRFFDEMNGVSKKALAKAIAGARVVPPPRKTTKAGPATSGPSED